MKLNINHLKLCSFLAVFLLYYNNYSQSTLKNFKKSTTSAKTLNKNHLKVITPFNSTLDFSFYGNSKNNTAFGKKPLQINTVLNTTTRRTTENNQSPQFVLASDIGRHNTQNTIITGIVLSLLSITIVLLLVLIFSRNKFYKKTMQQLINENQQIKEHQSIILGQHPPRKDDELMVAMLSIKERLNKLTHIKDNLSAAIKYNNRDELHKVEQRFEQLILSIDDLSIINDKIELKYPKVVSKIRSHFPKLSSNDIKHCLFLKLNLSIKESAQLLNVSTHAVKMARKRLKKKIDIPNNVTLRDHLYKEIS